MHHGKMIVELAHDGEVVKYLFEGPNTITVGSPWNPNIPTIPIRGNLEMPRIAMFGENGFAVEFDPDEMKTTGTVHYPFERCEHVSLDNLLRLNESTPMICPACTDGKIALLFDVVDCDRCGGKGVLRTEEPTDTFALRFDGTRFKDPRPLHCTFAYEGCVPQAIYSEQELFGVFGQFERLQMLKKTFNPRGTHNSDWEITGQKWDGRTIGWKLCGDGDLPDEMIDNFAFVKSWSYRNLKVIVAEILEEFLKLSTVGDNWTQLQPATPQRYAAQTVFGGHQSPQALRHWLHRTVQDVICEINHDPRGKCWSTEVNKECDNDLVVSVDRDGYGCTVHVNFDNMRDQVQIGWITRL